LAGTSIYKDLYFVQKYMPDTFALLSHQLFDMTPLYLMKKWGWMDSVRFPRKPTCHRADADVASSMDMGTAFRSYLMEAEMRQREDEFMNEQEQQEQQQAEQAEQEEQRGQDSDEKGDQERQTSTSTSTSTGQKQENDDRAVSDKQQQQPDVVVTSPLHYIRGRGGRGGRGGGRGRFSFRGRGGGAYYSNYSQYAPQNEPDWSAYDWNAYQQAQAQYHGRLFYGPPYHQVKKPEFVVRPDEFPTLADSKAALQSELAGRKASKSVRVPVPAHPPAPLPSPLPVSMPVPLTAVPDSTRHILFDDHG
jgi:hypothetical protein